VAAAIGGALVALFYHRVGLTLSHYDARGHLIVARRIFDSITPGWEQIGAIWLPLPHVLNAIPVQIDLLYRTGASGVAISVASFAIAAAAVAWLVFAFTRSRGAAIAGAAVFALNPNVLYLQATPMTESLLFALLTAAVAMLVSWSRTGRPAGAAAGWALALACLTRYEAWPVTVCALGAALWARARAGDRWSTAARRVAAIGAYPLAAVIGFVVFSKIVIDEWFVTSGFFVPDNPSAGRPLLALTEILWGIRTLSGYALVGAGGLGLVALAVSGLAGRRRGDWLLPLSLAATAAVPWYAFLQGHPFRVRYMVPLVVAQAVGAGVAAGLLPVGRFAVAALVAIVALELRPLDRAAPMVVEAQWDRPNSAMRQRVTDCLRRGYRGETIMASMGSLGHYMQELALAGFDIRDFLHEGNGEIWARALQAPRPYAGWILIEERAEGGDMLARLAREHQEYLAGFSRACEGGGVALYRRDPRPEASEPHVERE
jgi:hypothetical protein